jgi:sortase A
MRVTVRAAGWQIAESIFLIAGLALVDWYIWTQAGAILYQAWENRVFLSELRQLRTAPAAAPRGLPAETSAGRPGRPRRDALVGRLEIPRLGMRAMVREGDDEATLSYAVGHLPSSPLPGASGNVALAGHRDTFFRPLQRIRANDRITLATLRGTFEYRVESVRIVGPGDVSVLDASAEPTLTLVTCYPFRYIGSAPKRFIVRARQVGESPPLVERASLGWSGAP